MAFKIFEQPCKKCGESNFGPREGAKARGRWLGYDLCLKCRQEERDAEDKEE